MKKCLVFLLVLILALPITVHSESATATLQEMYAQAELLMVQGDYIGAAAKFEALGAYTDASQMTMYCKAIAAAETLGMYSMAIDAFNDLGDFKDSAQLAIYYQGRSYESASAVNITSATDSALKEALFFAEEAQKIYGGLAFFKDSMTRMAACNTKISDIQGELNRRAAAAKEETYQKALALEQSGNFADAISLYKSLGNYKDSQERIAICETGINEAVYQQALALEQSGNYAEAIELYETIIHYKDSAEKIMGCIYQQALALEQCGDYAGAIELYQSIKDYKDSADRIVACQTAINEAIYQQALALEQNDSYAAAVELYQSILTYKDSAQRIDALTILLTKSAQITPLYQGVSAYQLNDKWGLISASGRRVTDPLWDSIGAFSDGLALIQANSKYGYVDITGQTVIAPQYDRALDFSEGLAAVEANGLWGYIDVNGQYVLEPQWKIVNTDYVGSFSEGKVHMVMPDPKSSYATLMGYIDTSGQTVIAPQWDTVAPFSEGLAAVHPRYKTIKGSVSAYGYIDTTGKLVTDVKWSMTYPFNNGIAVVSGEDDWAVIDTSGNVLFTLNQLNNGAWKYIQEASEGLIIIGDKYYKGLRGCLDQTGKVIVPVVYESMDAFSNGLARVKKDGLYGFVDTHGNVVIEPQWLLATSFSDGLAWVWDGAQWRLIDTLGAIVPFSQALAPHAQ